MQIGLLDFPLLSLKSTTRHWRQLALRRFSTILVVILVPQQVALFNTRQLLLPTLPMSGLFLQMPYVKCCWKTNSGVEIGPLFVMHKPFLSVTRFFWTLVDSDYQSTMNKLAKRLNQPTTDR